MKSEITHSKSGDSFVGPEAVNVYRAIVIGSALRFYAKTGMKMNRAYTPTAMLRAASSMTGKTFKRGQYLQAAEALYALAQKQREAIPERNTDTGEMNRTAALAEAAKWPFPDPVAA